MAMLSDLDAAMTQPGLSVPAVRRLGGTMRRDSAGHPLRVTGRDAVIYELDAPDGRIWALRCFLRPDPARDAALAERYAELASDPRLAPLRGPDRALPRDIRWIGDGVTITGPDFHSVTIPVLAMERVPGRTLLRTVDRLCREGHREPISRLADSWLAAASGLAAAEFVHGDLAADNLMVRPDGSLALIDLDTAIWRSAGPLATTAAGGTPGYAHPRGAAHDPSRRDRFPALILWASLRVLARHPELRERWGDHPDRHGGALLWSADELRRPGRSPLFAALDDLHDETLAPLLEVVRRAIRFPPDETPPLTEIAERLESIGFPRLASSAPSRRTGISPPATEASPGSGWPVAAPTWEEPVVLPPPDRDPVPARPALPQTTTLAARERRIAAAQQLRAAVESRDTVKAVQLWEEHRAIPEAAPFAASVHLLIARDATAAIDRALRRGDDHGLVAAVAEAERAGVAPSPEARGAYRRARERIAARGALREAMSRGDLDTLARLACAGELGCLGRLEPEQARAVARARVWPALDRALARDDDAAIVAAADPAFWNEESAMPLAARERVLLARARLQWLSDIRAGLQRRDGAAMRTLLENAPPGAEQRLTEVESRRILRFSVRETAVARLEKALREGPDREVVAALAAFEAAGAPFSDVLDWTAVRGVVDRISLMEKVREAATANPPDPALLARLLPAARAALHEHAGHGEPDWQELERFVLRAAHLARLREALVTGHAARIAAAADPDPYDARGLLTPREAERLALALKR